MDKLQSAVQGHLPATVGHALKNVVHGHLPPNKLTGKIAVAVAGATGHLGGRITQAFLSPEFNKYFSKVVLFSRDSNNPKLQAFEKAGAEIREYDLEKPEDLEKSFSDIDVVVNAVSGGHSGHVFKEALLKAITSPISTVKLYFPSEFGVDHNCHDFTHAEWDAKKKHAKLAKSASSYMKVCCVYTGLFLEDSIGPWFGLNTKEGQYEAIGSADVPVSFVSLNDVGKVVATLAGVIPQEDLPAVVRVNGDSKSISQIAKIMEAAGSSPIKVTVQNMGYYKTGAVGGGDKSEPAGCLRFLMGEGKINHEETAMGNSNELLNPGQKSWKWKTVEDYARETKGRPWCD